MKPLRLGVVTLVYDEAGRVLVSKRGDLAVWNFPTGRLDRGESIATAALREVREETGIEASDPEPIGLSFQQGRQRLNFVFRAQATGGSLRQATDESSENRFVALDALPKPLFGDFLLTAYQQAAPFLHTLETPAEKLRAIQRKLAWRWVRNLLAGRPEPRWPRFAVAARVYATYGDLALSDGSAGTAYQDIAALSLHGESAPWAQAGAYVARRVEPLQVQSLRWLGYAEDVRRGVLWLYFHLPLVGDTQAVMDEIEWADKRIALWHPTTRPFAQHAEAGSQTVLMKQLER